MTLLGKHRQEQVKQLPLVSLLLKDVIQMENYVQALVLCPTRELSIQVAEEIGKLAKYKKRNICSSYIWWAT